MNDSVWGQKVSLDDVGNSFSIGEGHLEIGAGSGGGSLNNFAAQGLDGAGANIGGQDFGSDDVTGQDFRQLSCVGDQATNIDAFESRVSWRKNGERSLWKSRPQIEIPFVEVN